MRYDIDDIAARVEDKRAKFKKYVIAGLLLIATSLCVAIFYPETTVVFICAVVIIAVSAFLWRFIHKNNPLVLFGKGFQGVNIKEHEYVTAGTRLTRYGGLRYRYIPSRHKGDVYIRCEDGEVVAVTYLPKKHLDIFEIGDELVVYPGTRYPNVCGRDASEMPCPICGYVNLKSEERCESCGLKIAKM